VPFNILMRVLFVDVPGSGVAARVG
jgi:hypothetical protein